MNSWLLVISVFFPMAFGIFILATRFERRTREILCLIAVCINTAFVIALVAGGNSGTVEILRLTPSIAFAFRIDGISRIFALLVSCLWPIATLYAYEYMYHEKRENTFFGLYTATFGITMGICFAANLITMYFFYELLTLITVPLIMHSRGPKSKPAGIKYIAYSIAGATLAFAGIMIIYGKSGTFDFAEGGMSGLVSEPIVLIAFLMMFFGFGVKAAVFPLHDWLPTVGVAPTPVTALLHAVAVVKSGCFAIIRITYYVFGVSVLFGTWAQIAAIIFASFTIAFGSVRAWRETHFKRRLAMSTVSNLSYIILGAMVMTPAGITAGFLHMLFHGVMKICLFFVAGACHVQAHADYVTDLDGYGRKMPVTFGAFTIASLALIGVPPFCGFYSKYALGTSAAELIGTSTGAGATVAGYLGIAALLISAVFTAAYLLTIVVRAYFPKKDFNMDKISDVKDPGWRMKVPFIILAVLCVVLGLCQSQIAEFISVCTGGLF